LPTRKNPVAKKAAADRLAAVAEASGDEAKASSNHSIS